MKIPHPRLAAALMPVVLGAAAAIVIAAMTGAPRPGGSALEAAVQPSVVVLNCPGKQQVRPSQIVLACADGNAYLSGLHWTTWGSAAYGTGTWRINDCTPYCAKGTFHSFTALAVLWRTAPLPQHPDLRYYTRITMILPGTHCYWAAGKRTCYPVTYTEALWDQTANGLPVSQ